MVKHIYRVLIVILKLKNNKKMNPSSSTLFPKNLFSGGNHNNTSSHSGVNKKKKKLVDLSRVDPEDRSYIKAIIQRITKYEDPAPDVDFEIYPVGDHYNVVVIGWTSTIDDETWYKTFLQKEGPNRRETVFDPIISTSTTPSVEDGANTGPIKLFRIRRSGFNSSRDKRKK